jgi:hypothetical protein
VTTATPETRRASAAWLRALELTAPIARAPGRLFPVVVDELAARGLMQARQRAREIGDTGESELIEGDGGHVVLANSDGP